MIRIILTRHGHVEGIDPLRFRGREDVPLTELGRRQAAATGYRIAGEWTPSAIYSSPLSRCLATAAAIADVACLPVRSCPDLADLDYGEWQWRMVMERHENETVVLVGHDSVNRALLLQLLDQPPSAYWRLVQAPCALNEIVIQPSAIRVLRVNDWHHLT